MGRATCTEIRCIQGMPLAPGAEYENDSLHKEGRYDLSTQDRMLNFYCNLNDCFTDKLPRIEVTF